MCMSFIAPLAPPHEWLPFTSGSEKCNIGAHVASHDGRNTKDKMTTGLSKIWLQCIKFLCNMHSLCAVQLSVPHVS